MNATEILNELKANRYKPIYFLHGEEPYELDKIADYIDKYTISEAEKGFNQTILYGKDTSWMEVIGAAKRYPMMADRQVVIVREAQNLKYTEEETLLLQSYLNHPLESTILVFVHKNGKADGRSKAIKLMAKNGVVFESKKMYDNQLPEWITTYVSQKGYAIMPEASNLIAESLGLDLHKVANEIDKMLINMPERGNISVDMVSKQIGVSKDFNVFELQKAIGKRDYIKAQQIAIYFTKNPKSGPFVMVVGNLIGFFTKIYLCHTLTDKSKANLASKLGVNPYFVGDYETALRNFNYPSTLKAISLLREYDLKSKGVDNNSASGEELLPELIFKLLN